MTLSLSKTLEQLEEQYELAELNAAVRGRNLVRVLKLRQKFGKQIREAKEDRRHFNNANFSTRYVDNYIRTVREKLEIFESRYQYLKSDYHSACNEAYRLKMIIAFLKEKQEA